MGRDTPPGSPAGKTEELTYRRKRDNSVYALQVRAFIEAAEVVDADADVIEDILDGFDVPDDEGEGGGDDSDIDVESAYFGAVNDQDGSETEFDGFLREAQQTWSKQEVKLMITWLKEHGMPSFIEKYVVSESIPIPKLLYAFDICLCAELRAKRPKTLLYFLEVALSRELQAREKLPMYNTIDDAAELIRTRKNILILTGAGISVSCGIPDFRSRNGLYAMLQEKGQYDLDDPHQMFDIHYFREHPNVFYSFASQIYPSNFIPSPCHRFIKLIEDKGKLLRNYTQNIDNLERQAGVQRVLQCHGSFATASCLQCRHCVPGTEIEEDLLNQVVPLCEICNAPMPESLKALKKKGKKKKSGWNSDESDEPDKPAYPPGIMKPDITFFGEKLTDSFERSLLQDRQQIDLLLVIGTSLKVSPVSEILAHLPHSVPQILINKTPIKHINPDIVLLGNADDIVQHLCQKIGWDLPAASPTKRPNLDAPPSGSKKRASEVVVRDPQRVGDSHVWLFEGAEGGKWIEDIARECEAKKESSTAPSDAACSDNEAQRRTKKAKIT